MREYIQLNLLAFWNRMGSFPAMNQHKINYLTHQLNHLKHVTSKQKHKLSYWSRQHKFEVSKMLDNIIHFHFWLSLCGQLNCQHFMCKNRHLAKIPRWMARCLCDQVSHCEFRASVVTAGGTGIKVHLHLQTYLYSCDPAPQRGKHR
jgi:hypothetical protein